jgi:SAM-dependent methyltransferase
MKDIIAILKNKVSKKTPSDNSDFPGSGEYWKNRYIKGGDSGVGSYSFFADFKAEIINRFIQENRVEDAIEFGCGDGYQTSLINYKKYTGFDISKIAISKSKKLFKKDKTKSFYLLKEYNGEKAELSLSLDVIYHLVEEDVFKEYMKLLFNGSNKYVIIYSSNMEGQIGEHIKHRKITNWICQNIKGWRLINHIPNKFPYIGDYTKGSFSDFYFYQKLED